MSAKASGCRDLLNRITSVLCGWASCYTSVQGCFRVFHIFLSFFKTEMPFFWELFFRHSLVSSPTSLLPTPQSLCLSFPAVICLASSHGLSLQMIHPQAFSSTTLCSHPPRDLLSLSTSLHLPLVAKWMPINSTVLQLEFWELYLAQCFEEKKNPRAWDVDSKLGCWLIAS